MIPICSQVVIIMKIALRTQVKQELFLHIFDVLQKFPDKCSVQQWLSLALSNITDEAKIVKAFPTFE